MNLFSLFSFKKSIVAPPAPRQQRQPLPLVTDVITAPVEQVIKRYEAVSSDTALDASALIDAFNSAVSGVRQGVIYEEDITPVLLLIFANSASYAFPFPFGKGVVELLNAKINVENQTLTVRFDAFTRKSITPRYFVDDDQVYKWSGAEIRRFRATFSLTSLKFRVVDIDGSVVKVGDLYDQICPNGLN